MSISSAVESVKERARKKGVREIRVEKADNGGYVTHTQHHDYEKPTTVGAHKSLQSVMAHIKSCYGGKENDLS